MLTLLYNSLNIVINAFSSGCCGAWLRANEVDSAAEVGLCCTHNAPIPLSSGFSISQGNAEALDRWGGKTKHRLIFTFSVTLLLEIIVIGSCMSRL